MTRRDIAAGILVGTAFAAFAWWCSRDFDPPLPPEPADPANEFGPSLEDVVATQLLAEASAEACLAGESVVAAAERICRCEAPTGEFPAITEGEDAA
jgi:hypothetical protein